jgi:hypothetical protein
MKISDSNIFLDSSRAYVEKDEVKENLRVWVGQSGASGSSQSDRVSISTRAELLLEDLNKKIDEANMADEMDTEISLKRLIAEILSGRKIENINIDRAQANEENSELGNGLEAGPPEQRQGWGLQYDYEEPHHEKEDVRFEAKGIIRTSDGKDVVFTLRLDMNREYIEKNRMNIRAGDAVIDPLIINFDGRAADLSNARFDFDLNSDGNTESISIPKSGSGFLAIDLNGDGIINNGSELFGPSTGNGFNELGWYDSDNNRWIDENDEVFNDLKVLTVGESGDSDLNLLSSTGVGAIYLGRNSTQFDIRTSTDNSLLGQVRSTGIYLRENGTPGTIQQLDLVA